MIHSRKLAIFTLYFVYFLDFVGFAIVFVIFSPLILKTDSTILAATTTLAKRNLILGFLLGSYPLTEFFGAPILGEFSDRFGRRPILLLSTLGTGVCACLTGFSINIDSLWLLFASRLATGFFAGNTTVTMAAAADITTAKARGRYMAIFAAAGGVGWTIGPYIGVLLAEISYAEPFWVLAALFLISFLLVMFVFSSSPKKEKKSLQLHLVFSRLLQIFRIRPLIPPFLTMAISFIGFRIYLFFLAAYLIEKYHFKEFAEGLAYAFAAMAWFVGAILASQWLFKHFSIRHVLIAPIFLVGLLVLMFQFTSNIPFIWFLAISPSFFEAIVQGGIFALLSLLAPLNMQGRVFGALNASIAFAGFIAPILSGWLAGYAVNLPFLIAAIVLLAIAVYYTVWALRACDKTT